MGGRFREIILEVENFCEFKTITAAERVESKFLPLIGKSTETMSCKRKSAKLFWVDCMDDLHVIVQ